MRSSEHQKKRITLPATTKLSGFTLIELMITIVIVIILVAIAVPQYTSSIHAQKISAEANNLLNDIQFVRSEAIKEGQYVSMCVSSSGTTCSSGTWDTGWIIYSNPNYTTSATYSTGDTILRVQKGFTSGDQVATTPSGTVTLSYNREGFGANLTSPGVVFAVQTNPEVSALTRCVSVDVIGRQTILTTSTATCT